MGAGRYQALHLLLLQAAACRRASILCADLLRGSGVLCSSAHMTFAHCHHRLDTLGAPLTTQDNWFLVSCGKYHLGAQHGRQHSCALLITKPSGRLSQPSSICSCVSAGIMCCPRPPCPGHHCQPTSAAHQAPLHAEH